MKEIKAHVQPHMLPHVVLALSQVPGLSGLSVTKVQGFGRGRGRGQPRRIVEDQIDYVPHAKIEVFCRDDQVESIVGAIQTSARTGLKGDGKIYVTDVVQAIRISTGERGQQAV